MPPRIRYKKETIIDIAFEYVRKNGWNGLTARYISDQINASTMPIYSCFKSMRQLEDEVVKRAMELCMEYLTTPRTGDAWIDNGVGYVLFARNEKYLFRAAFDEEHVDLRKKYDQLMWEQVGEGLRAYARFRTLSENQLNELRRGRWVLLHGLACLINTKQIVIRDEREIRLAVERASRILLSGIVENVE
jgi:AcrR family transcriptional regulator